MIKLIICILLCLSAGLIGSIFTMPAINSWYIYLNKPSFNPPGWLFGPVWTTLYILMGISLYLFLNSKKKKPLYSIDVFALQLLLNFMWSIIFFGFKNILFAFINIFFLWVLILMTILKFYKVNKTSGLLLIPYLLWVTFAAILNFSILILN